MIKTFIIILFCLSCCIHVKAQEIVANGIYINFLQPEKRAVVDTLLINRFKEFKLLILDSVKVSDFKHTPMQIISEDLSSIMFSYLPYEDKYNSIDSLSVFCELGKLHYDYNSCIDSYLFIMLTPGWDNIKNIFILNMVDDKPVSCLSASTESVLTSFGKMFKESKIDTGPESITFNITETYLPNEDYYLKSNKTQLILDCTGKISYSN